jgi:hypothetical protein
MRYVAIAATATAFVIGSSSARAADPTSASSASFVATVKASASPAATSSPTTDFSGCPSGQHWIDDYISLRGKLIHGGCRPDKKKGEPTPHPTTTP